MKKILFYAAAGLLMCQTAFAQTPAKAGAAAAKAVTNGGKIGVLKGARVPAIKRQGKLPAQTGRTGVTSASGRLNTAVLERTVARQAAAARQAASARKRDALRPTGPAPDLATLQSIRRQVAAGKTSSALIDRMLRVSPPAVRADLLQDEFLTLTLFNGAAVSAEQARLAVQLLRVDLLNRTAQLQQAAEQELSGTHVQHLARAVADVSALGWFGKAQDGRAILDFYRTVSATELEPVAFAASARALSALKAYQPLQQLLQTARPGYAQEQFAAFAAEQELPVSVPLAKDAAPKADFSAWEKPFAQVSRAAAMQLDVSADATRKWLSLKPRMSAAPKIAAKPSVAKQAVPKPAPQAPAAEEPVSQMPAAEEFAPQEAVSAADNSGVLYAGLPVMEWGKRIKNWFKPADKPAPAEAVAPAAGAYNPVVPVLETMPRTGLISKEYPSGLKDEESIIRDWLEYFKNGYFRPRDQVEAITGMSAAKANNVMEYLYYMPLEEAEKVILNPIRETGRLPDFMYDDRLIAGTRRLPAGYYKNKFNENVRRFVELAEEDGSIYTHNVELIDLATTMADYSFKQGFRYTNDPRLTEGLRHNWKELVGEIRKRGLKADRALINRLWRKPVELDGGKTVSLKDYFTQTRPTAFFAEGRMPEFFLNSEKWVALENERRNLAAAEYINRAAQKKVSWWEKFQNWLVLGKSSDYVTLDQFGKVMTAQYRQSFGTPVRINEQEYVAGASPSLLEDVNPSSLTVQINNFDKIGGVCQMSFADGGYAGRVREGYDGTSTVSRFEPVDFQHVKAVTFDVETLQPQVVTLNSVPYLKDLKSPDLDQVRAGTMVSDGLDPTRDLIGVQQAEAALTKIPHLKATIYPHARLVGYAGPRPAYLNGGGLGGYLALFTPPFYPIKTVYRLRFKGMKPYVEKEYFIRKEVPALAGLIHRDRLTFTQQVKDRVEQKGAAPQQKGAQPPQEAQTKQPEK